MSSSAGRQYAYSSPTEDTVSMRRKLFIGNAVGAGPNELPYVYLILRNGI